MLRRIIRDFDGELALDAWLIRPGAIRIGAPVALVDTSAQPEALGGWVVGAPYAGVRDVIQER